MNIIVNGVQLYYEKAGEGAPIILLHGNGEDHRIFGDLIKFLSKEYCVYAIDSRDHGKSSKVRELSYREMAEDVSAFMKALSIKKPIVLGFSDGGIIGLILAYTHPRMLSKLIVCGANVNPGGMKRRWRVFMHVSHFFTRDRKLHLMLTQPNILKKDLARIQIPVFVLAGSRDMIIESHTKKIAEDIPDGRLEILKKETHVSYVVDNQKLYDTIMPFLKE